MRKGTELGRVRGLGSARAGAHHWLQQRLTALGNLLLVSWLIISLLRLPLADHGAVSAWLSKPLVAVPMILLLVSVFWHIRLGLQVLIEDYVHGHAARVVALVALNFYVVAGAAYGLFAILRLALSGSIS